MSQYKSSTLKHSHGDCTCLVCQFVEGKRTYDTLMETIRILDYNLNQAETSNSSNIGQIIRLIAKLEDANKLIAGLEKRIESLCHSSLN